MTYDSKYAQEKKHNIQHKTQDEFRVRKIVIIIIIIIIFIIVKFPIVWSICEDFYKTKNIFSPWPVY